MSRRNNVWSAAVLACLAALVVASLCLRQSFPLTALSDLVQCLLLLSGTLAFLTRARTAKGRMRLFWSLMTLGLAFWLSYQFLWTYLEVYLRTEVPDIYAGDIVLFVHIVPLIAALALRPHVPRDQYAARLGHLDFALLFVWWVYLYVLLVMAWQYAVPNQVHYSNNLNAVYLAEKIFFLAALAASWVGSKSPWRSFYANLFGASLLYSVSSYLANWAISRKLYYSGSLYDIPLVASMAWITLTALWNKAGEPATSSDRASTIYGVWIARSGMIAAFSLPLFGAWALSDTATPPLIRWFRLVLTLTTALAMGTMVLTRQRLLDRELNRLLVQSRESFQNLKRLQAQVLQSEKMASVGQLVGGAAHELNNPITAMLGYSDLLLGTELSPAQQTLAAKISQHTRKTKSLVASLLSFAGRSPLSRAPVDLNTLVRTAIKFTQSESQALKIDVSSKLQPDLPRVLGDSNQLLQVCLQILGSSLRSIHARGGTRLAIITQDFDGLSVFTATEEAVPDAAHKTAPTSYSAGTDLVDPMGLTSCRRIVLEHHGEISAQLDEAGNFAVRLELPAATSCLTEKVSGVKVPALRQSRPFA